MWLCVYTSLYVVVGVIVTGTRRDGVKLIVLCVGGRAVVVQLGLSVTVYIPQLPPPFSSSG